MTTFMNIDYTFNTSPIHQCYIVYISDSALQNVCDTKRGGNTQPWLERQSHATVCPYLPWGFLPGTLDTSETAIHQDISTQGNGEYVRARNVVNVRE